MNANLTKRSWNVAARLILDFTPDSTFQVMILAIVAVVSLPRTARAQFGASTSQEGGAPAGKVVAIRAGRLFDSRNGRMFTDQLIVIRGDRVAEVGATGRVQAPDGARSSIRVTPPCCPA